MEIDHKFGGCSTFLACTHICLRLRLRLRWTVLNILTFLQLQLDVERSKGMEGGYGTEKIVGGAAVGMGYLYVAADAVGEFGGFFSQFLFGFFHFIFLLV